MKNEKTRDEKKRGAGNFFIEGTITMEQKECEPGEFKLTGYVFDKAGTILGQSDIDAKGGYRITVALQKPSDVELVIGPDADPKKIRNSTAFKEHIYAQDWQKKGKQFLLRFDTLLPLDIWWPWRSKRICIHGHIRKHIHQPDNHQLCPLPFVKVEIFDVDRDACLWPWLNKLPAPVDTPVIRIPDLIRNPPIPIPDPFPGPYPGPFPGPVPEPEPLPRPFPGPDPRPDLMAADDNVFPTSFVQRSARSVKSSAATGLSLNTAIGNAQADSRLDGITLTSKKAPWHIFPHCYYSRQLLCTTTTDCHGAFTCCFNWHPFYFRRGRLRFDSRPDIIVRITQVINGVSTVIYMDPYSGTRWNVLNAHIDLFLDNEDAVCGNSLCYQPPAGSPVFFTRIGNDEVYQIDQTTGLYHETPYTDVAYGSNLNIHAQFGDMLTRSDPGVGDATPYFYYRLSYARQGSSDEFRFIDINLNDTRVRKDTLDSDSHKLGPYTVNDITSLYEMRNFDDYYWYNPDWVGIWRTLWAEEDTGRYILRMEVFDKNGNYLDSASNTVDYRNGAGIGDGVAPSPLTAMTDHCDLQITLDNKPPVAEIEIPAATDDCGVIPWSETLSLQIHAHVSQENNRLREWKLWYTKGVGSEHPLGTWHSSNNGLPGIDHAVIDGAPLLIGLEGTCAFALRLRAWSHIRNGYGFIYHDQDVDAIVIDKCQSQLNINKVATIT